MPFLKNRFAALTLSTLVLLSSFVSRAQSGGGDTQADWVRPFPPFRIAGNLYYVGSYELGCYLITTKSGHILINTGVAGSERMIRSNMETLGFRIEDVRVLLNSQAHRDHVGAMAEMERLTRAKCLIDAGDSEEVATGGKSDYADVGTYHPFRVDRYLRNGDTIRLGNMAIQMLHHPGHTKGSCSFLFTVTDSQRSYRVLIANLPSIVTHRKFSGIPEYPGIANDYASTLSSLRRLSFDLWLTPHASQFSLHEKHRPGDIYNPGAFKDRKGFDEALDDLQKEFEEKLQQK